MIERDRIQLENQREGLIARSDAVKYATTRGYHEIKCAVIEGLEVSARLGFWMCDHGHVITHPKPNTGA